MAIYYVDNLNGNDRNNGLSENTPIKDYHKLQLCGGDTVLFKCGSFYRGKLDAVRGEENKPITYSSYGDGERPTFCGSVDILSDKDAWYEEQKNIWVTEKLTDDEVCNFVFNNEDNCGTLRWTKEEMCEQGDFFDNQFGTRVHGKPITAGHKVYLYSEKNPAEYYIILKLLFTVQDTLQLTLIG